MTQPRFPTSELPRSGSSPMSDSQPTLPSPSEGKSNAFSKDSKGHDESKDVQIEAEDVTETAPTSPKTDNDDTDPNSRSSKYRGVCREKKRWRAQISWQGHRFFLGGFQVEDKAALAYDIAHIYFHQHNEPDRLNFPSRFKELRAGLELTLKTIAPCSRETSLASYIRSVLRMIDTMTIEDIEEQLKNLGPTPTPSLPIPPVYSPSIGSAAKAGITGPGPYGSAFAPPFGGTHGAGSAPAGAEEAQPPAPGWSYGWQGPSKMTGYPAPWDPYAAAPASGSPAWPYPPPYAPYPYPGMDRYPMPPYPPAMPPFDPHMARGGPPRMREYWDSLYAKPQPLSWPKPERYSYPYPDPSRFKRTSPPLPTSAPASDGSNHAPMGSSWEDPSNKRRKVEPNFSA